MKKAGILLFSFALLVAACSSQTEIYPEHDVLIEEPDYVTEAARRDEVLEKLPDESAEEILPCPEENAEESGFYIFENYLGIEIASEELLSTFEDSHMALIRISGGTDVAVWAVYHPLSDFEIIMISEVVCDCCQNSFFIPDDSNFVIDVLPQEDVVILENYIFAGYPPQYGAAFTDSEGRRRYVAFVENLSGEAFSIVEIALEEGEMPWAFPPNHPRPGYVTFWSSPARTTITVLNIWGWGLGDAAIIPLEEMPYITTLYLQDSSISNISPLSSLTRLRRLWLFDNYITDISPLSGLTNLTDLSLQFNQVSDLTPLAGLTNLTHLDLAYNDIVDISPLAELTNLQRLRLCGNQISDLTPLAGLTNLTYLGLEENPISDWSPVEHIRNVHGRPRDE